MISGPSRELLSHTSIGTKVGVICVAYCPVRSGRA